MNLCDRPRLGPTSQSRRHYIPIKQTLRLRPAAVLVDLDGTLLTDGKPIDGAIELLQAFSQSYAVLTNNSAQTSAQIARQLRRADLPVCDDRVFAAGELLIDTLARDRCERSVYPVLSPTMIRLARHRGVRLVEPRLACTVAIGRTTSFNYTHLARAANAVAGGAELIAANPDGNHPRSGGGVVPETGAMVAAIMAASGRRQPARFVGKPDPYMAWRALEALGGVRAEDTVVVGDNPDTDGKLAQAIGARFVQVSWAKGRQ